jgi:hypothetical protein
VTGPAPDWREALGRDAVAVALPDWVWRVGDRVTVAVGHSDGGEHPTADGPPMAWAKVTVIRADWSGSASRLYVAGEVDDFWSALMGVGSEMAAQPAESHGDGLGVARGYQPGAAVRPTDD